MMLHGPIRPMFVGTPYMASVGRDIPRPYMGEIEEMIV